MLATAGALSLASAAPAPAIVGGKDASPGEYPSVALVQFGGVFQCTGTLVAPNVVLSAGHCGSVTGAAVSSPAAWPAALINVYIGGHEGPDGERVPVSRVDLHPSYLFNAGYDISLLHLSRNSTRTPTKIAGPAERDAWEVGDLGRIAGFGVTEEGGDSPDVLQEADVPIVADADCAEVYEEFDAATMVCAGYEQGGVDTCQGDSGGPMFGTATGGIRRVVGATSFGEGCARPGKPGVYARVADTTLREWIRGKAPAAIGS